MKKLLLTISFFLILAMVNAQVQTSYVVSSIAQMKTYYGTASKIYVAEKNSDYVICSPCTTDEVNVYAGAGGRKWMKVSDSAKVDVTKLNGGTSNQVLTKNSGTDGDYSWEDNGGGGSASGVDSTFIATTAGQTVFTFPYTIADFTTLKEVKRNGGNIDPSEYTISGSTITFTGFTCDVDDKIRFVGVK